LEAVRFARDNARRQVVFFAVGFETTAPATAEAILLARRLGVKNFSVLCAHVIVPPAIEAILAAGTARLNGLIAPGHVCSITGLGAYESIANEYLLPVVVTGFEPLDIVQAIHELIRMLESGCHGVHNQYARVVNAAGNGHALRSIETVFLVTDRVWRGIGTIRNGGYAIRSEYAEYDGAARFGILAGSASEPGACMAGSVLQGLIKPPACPMFGNDCSPMHPKGAPMVSSEGACAAYFRYRPTGAGH
jgi:hydrogenase expression/formation protein HypD